jgi:hypothetical protein
MDQWMTLPLKPGAVLPKAKVYKNSPRDAQFIDEVHDRLHAQGKMHYATRHTPVVNPVFVVWKRWFGTTGRSKTKGAQ